MTASRSGVNQIDGEFCMGVCSSVPGSRQTCFDDSTSSYVFIRFGGLKYHRYYYIIILLLLLEVVVVVVVVVVVILFLICLPSDHIA